MVQFWACIPKGFLLAFYENRSFFAYLEKQTLNIINQLTLQGVTIIFIRQPELSTTGPHTQLLLAIYSYFAETEREFISIRTKQGLAAAKAQGKQLGRPKGSRNRERPLDVYREEIQAYLQLGLSIAAIQKLINKQLEIPLTYNSYKYFIIHDGTLQAYVAK